MSDDTPRAAMTWINAVDWRHEVAHTAVLETLLKDPSIGRDVGQALFDLPVFVDERVTSDGPVLTKVSGPQRERAAPGGRRGVKADLVFQAELLGSPQSVCFAVETKVDSAGSHRQLHDTIGPDGNAVLLALGLTGLRLSRRDTEKVNRQCGLKWRFIDVVGWERLLRQLDLRSQPGFVRDYFEALGGRATKQADASARARRGEGAREEHWQLDQCAWLAAVREALEDIDVEWTLGRMISGELMTNAFSSRSWRDQRTGADLFLQFDGSWNTHRSFSLRGGSTTASNLVALREDEMLRRAAAEIGLETSTRSVAARWRSAVISDIAAPTLPAEAAGVARAALELLAEPARKALSRLS